MLPVEVILWPRSSGFQRSNTSCPVLACMSRYDADIKHDGDKDEVSRGDSGKESHKDEDDDGQICFIGERAVSSPFSLR